MPWWSTSSFLKNQQFSPPPPATITLSVVSRIKNGGWLTTVSNAASSAAGKVLVPSGVVAAVFHSSLRQNMLSASFNSCALEHLLVYSPSGHLIQYQLLPLLGREQSESYSRNGSGSLVLMQEDELRVKFEPVQWWDVCRRADWPEREESIRRIIHGRRGTAESVMGTSCYDNEPEGKEHMRPLDRSHWYLSNAEVHFRSGRLPIWQKSKIYLYTMDLHGCEELNPSEDEIGGEIEIEKISVRQIDLRSKELLPIFDHFQTIHPARDDNRKHFTSRFPGSTIVSHNSMEKSEDSVASETNSITIGLTEKSSASKKTFDGSLSTPASLHDYDEMGMLAFSPQIDLIVDENDGIRSSGSMLASSPLNQRSYDGIGSFFPESSENILSYVEESYVVNSPNSPKRACLTEGPGTLQGQPSGDVVAGGILSLSTNQSDTSVSFNDEGKVLEDMHHPIGFGQYFQEGYCKVSNSGEPYDLTERIADIYSKPGPCNKEKPEEDKQSDGMLGGIFALSEEG